jgi:ferredoxin-NADP reductase
VTSDPEPTRPSGEHTGELIVISRSEVAQDVVAVELADPDGAALPRWAPGAHVEVVLGGSGLVRHYSLCGCVEDSSRWRIAVLRETPGRGGSAYVHDRLRPGQRLRFRGPRNHFPLVDADDYLFVAGGIGITALLPMASQVAGTRRNWKFLYLARSHARVAFESELLAIGAASVHVHVDDEAGPVDLDAVLAGCTPNTVVYACGPGGLLDALESRHSAQRHWRLHVERFRVDAPVQGSSHDDTTFEVELARSGRRLVVPPGRSVLSVLLDNGVDLLWSCGEGTCGTCETVVLDGVPEHRDHVLSPAEKAAGELFMPCVSRASSPRLVIDL